MEEGVFFNADFPCWGTPNLSIAVKLVNHWACICLRLTLRGLREDNFFALGSVFLRTATSAFFKSSGCCFVWSCWVVVVLVSFVNLNLVAWNSESSLLETFSFLRRLVASPSSWLPTHIYKVIDASLFLFAGFGSLLGCPTVLAFADALRPR